MCKQCFSRSAAILSAVLNHSPVPTPTAEEVASTHGEWNESTVEVARQYMAIVAEYARTDVKNDKLDKIIEGLTVQQIDAFATLMEACARHLKSMGKCALIEIGDRAVKGNTEALGLLTKKAILTLSQRDGDDTNIVGELLKEAKQKPGRPIDVSLN